MIFRSISLEENSELEVSNICLGTWPIGGGMGAIEQKDAINAIHASIDNGINFLDTAQMYLDSEYILGKAIKGKRNKIILASKLSSWKNINDIENLLNTKYIPNILYKKNYRLIIEY